MCTGGAWSKPQSSTNSCTRHWPSTAPSCSSVRYPLRSVCLLNPIIQTWEWCVWFQLVTKTISDDWLFRISYPELRPWKTMFPVSQDQSQQNPLDPVNIQLQNLQLEQNTKCEAPREEPREHPRPWRPMSGSTDWWRTWETSRTWSGLESPECVNCSQENQGELRLQKYTQIVWVTSS